MPRKSNAPDMEASVADMSERLTRRRRQEASDRAKNASQVRELTQGKTRRSRAVQDVESEGLGVTEGLFEEGDYQARAQKRVTEPRDFAEQLQVEEKLAKDAAEPGRAVKARGPVSQGSASPGNNRHALLFHYTAHPTIARMHSSDALVKCVWGPYGSGKTTGCIAEIVNTARTKVPPMLDGVRRSKWAIVRASRPNLWRATVPSFHKFLPPSVFGRFVKTDMEAHYRFDDGMGLVEIVCHFIGLDHEDDAEKLRSTEYTGAFINEGSEISPNIFRHLRTRLGRDPSSHLLMPGSGPVPKVCLIDTNPTDEDHWIHKAFFDKANPPPPTWELFRQPGGLEPDAENLQFLPGGRKYYHDFAGAPKEWLNVFRDGNPGFVPVGKEIFPGFQQHIHATQQLTVRPELPLVIGIDFGRSPAAVFMQRMPTGVWHCLLELVSSDTSVQLFAEQILPLVRAEFGSVPSMEIYGDPAGMADSQTRDENCFDILRGAGLHAEPTDTNNPAIRFEAVRRLLRRLDENGDPFLMIDRENCPTLVKAMAGGYAYKEDTDKANKNRFSHVADALQYALLGGGEDIELTTDDSYRESAWDRSKGSARLPHGYEQSAPRKVGWSGTSYGRNNRRTVRKFRKNYSPF